MFDIINQNKPNLIQKCYTPSGQATVNQVNVNMADLLMSSVSMLAPAAPTMERISWSHAACSKE